MSGFLARRSLRRALLSKEGLVVLLAFVLTVGVYGALFLSLVSTPKREPAASRLVAPVTLLLHEGCVWRLSLPLPAELAGAEVTGVRLAVDGVEHPVALVRASPARGGAAVLGTLATSIASGVVRVAGLGPVDLVVYIDPDGRLTVLVDDDFDGLMDESYLVKFVQGLSPPAGAAPGADWTLSVPRSSALPLEHLDALLAASPVPSPAVVIYDGQERYYLPVAEIARNLKRAVAYLVSSEGRASVAVVLPCGVVRGDARLSLRVDIGGRTLEAAVAVPADLAGTGELTVLPR